MAETFDYAATDPGSGGENLCGDSFTQSAVAKFLPAGYLVFGPQDGPYTRVDAGAGLPVEIQNASLAVTGPLTDTQLRASAVPVSGTFWQATQPVSGPLTDAQLRAVAVPVSGTFWQATQPVSGPLTDTQLRAVAVPVSGTFWQATQPVSGPLTDTQWRAAAVPVSGTFWQATQPVSIAATVAVDTELPAAATLADAASLPSAPTLGAAGLTYNGATLDLRRGTVEGTALASASRSASTASGSITNHNSRALFLCLNITSNASAVQVRLYVETLDPASGNWVTMTPTPAAITGTGCFGIAMGPGAATAGTAGTAGWLAFVSQGQLSRTWRVFVGQAGAGNVTYSVAYCLLP